MNKYFEETLPEGYKEVFSIDATNTKTTILLSIAALIITLAGVCISILSFPIHISQLLDEKPKQYFVFIGVFSISLIVYLVLHELTHGVVYKHFTKKKLTYGFTLTVAYCGIPDIFVYRKTALLSLCAPLIVFTILFTAGMLIVAEPIWKLCFALLLSFHFGGCCGDIYDILLYLFRFKDDTILMNDTGPKQTFYANNH